MMSGERRVDFKGYSVERNAVVIGREGRCCFITERSLVVTWSVWGLPRYVAGGIDGAEIEGGSCLADGLIGLGVLGERDEGASWTQDAGLFAGDLGDGVAEIVLMIQSDVGEDGEDRVDYVGGVQTAPEAYFEDGDVYRGLLTLRGALSCEVKKAYSGEDLEKARRVG
jgi:hypothetical protein